MTIKKGIAVWLAFLIVTLMCSSSSNAKTPEPIRHIGLDIKDTFTMWPAAVLLGGAVLSGGLYMEDKDIQSSFSDHRHLGKADTVAGYAGEAYVVDSAAALAWGIGWLAHDEKVSHVGEALVESLVLTETSAAALKFAFRRQRPNGGKYSFPSAHAARTFAAASVLEAMAGPAYGVPAYLAAAFITFTRLDANVHFSSDLLFGAALGTAIGWGTSIFHIKEFDKVKIMPVAGEMTGLMATIIF